MRNQLKNFVKEIKDSDGNLIAVYFNVFSFNENVTWIPTPFNWGLQVGIFKHDKGYRVEPHLHLRERCEKYIGCEALFVIKGKLRVKLFDRRGQSVCEIVMSEGDCLVMCTAHSVEVLEETLAIEIKEGPYPGRELDKIML